MYPSSAVENKTLLLSPLSPLLPDRPAGKVIWRQLLGAARGLAIASAAGDWAGPTLIVARDANTARLLENELRFFLGRELPILPFPDWECLPYDSFSPPAELVAQRLTTLAQLPTLQHGVVIAHVATLLHPLPPVAFVTSQSFNLDRGDALAIDEFRERLVNSGYHAVSQVMEPGEFAVRGGIVDLFPVGTMVPYRLDLFGEVVETIREFDPATQRSGRSVDAIHLLPAREFPLNESGIARFRQAFRARFEGDPQKISVYRDVSKGFAPAGVEFYLPLFYERTATFFDYLPGGALCVLEDGITAAAREFLREAAQRYAERAADRERPLLTPTELFSGIDALQQQLDGHPTIELEGLEAPERHIDAPTIAFNTQPPPQLPVDHKSDQPYRTFIDHIRAYAGRVLIVAETPGRLETLRGLLVEQGFAPRSAEGWQDFLASSERLALCTAELERALELPDLRLAVIVESQLYGDRVRQRRRRGIIDRDPEAIIRSLAELRLGDPVVHEDHGVGRYLGLQTLDVGDGPNEFLTLEYADGDKLYIPVLSLHLITRYTGTNPDHAPLHKLGSDAWERAKRRAMEKAYDAAAELLEINALRASRPGESFPAHDVQCQAFAEAFPFEETPDQSRAIDEVLQDMEGKQPMDRLVCGDVGFGKTEVAMRAAFIAAHNGAQVAVLVPTTLLAQQHFQNFRDRFAGLPHRVELLSRFRSKSEQARVLADLTEGRIDIVVGTHRLLQPDVRFKHLGLVILDEEHRFGVRQKERLKQLRAETDILTLTATPIPRTLNMALAGMREISIIATPPQGRLAVKTLVAESSKSLIREAVLREIRRGGQVYYLHNEVRTIERAARELHELLPEAEVQVAHGQMPERELERVMLDFYHQRFNVLVCSTIIESGIDVPSANTIIIERADKFGLAQLHQLRGRVGRSHTRAYCYLLIPGRRVITEDARKRLEAIESLEELGAGFTLASHDLEIRGAGELLGESQSGQIDEVGFTLYSELLERAVQSIKAGVPLGAIPSRPPGTEVNLHAPTLLPEYYIPDIHLRLILYKRIANARDAESLQLLREEIIDRFGRLPEPATLLFQATAIKLRATAIGIRRLDAGAKGLKVEFTDNPNLDPAAMIHLLQSAPKLYRLDGPSRLRVMTDLTDTASRIQAIEKLLTSLPQATPA